MTPKLWVPTMNTLALPHLIPSPSNKMEEGCFVKRYQNARVSRCLCTRVSAAAANVRNINEGELFMGGGARADLR